MRPFILLLGCVGTAALASAPGSLSAQRGCVAAGQAVNGRTRFDQGDTSEEAPSYKFSSAKDRLAWDRARALAAKSGGFRIVVSLQDCRLWAIVGRDTVMSARAAVAKGTTLKLGKSKWTFDTPRGMRTVLGKEANPIWQPPEWLYAEAAAENGLTLGHISPQRPIKLAGGGLLTVRNHLVGVIRNGEFMAMPIDEHIVFGETLYVPPLGTRNRMVEGELGKYRLMLGDGYLFHGTPYQQSIGMAATHGCIRLRDEDIEWMYEHVPVGTKVYIF